jgi:starch synthase
MPVPGGPYVGPDGLDWPDNADFASPRWARIAADIGLGLVPAIRARHRARP